MITTKSKTTKIQLPNDALVILVGPAASGKSTFAAEHFPPESIVSSDVCRYLVNDDMVSQDANDYSFALFHTWIRGRLAMGHLTVADATNLTGNARKALLEVAKEFHRPVVGIVIDTPKEMALRFNQERERYVPEHVIDKHYKRLVSAKGEVFTQKAYWGSYIYQPEDTIEIIPVLDGFKTLSEGWDVIGDLHGCAQEHWELLEKLGYIQHIDSFGVVRWDNPEGRKLAYVGDITDRGPLNLLTLRDVYNLWAEGLAEVVPGNHDNKLWRYLKGNPVKPGPGLQKTIQEIANLSVHEKEKYRDFLGAISKKPHRVLGVRGYAELVIAHAGLRKEDVGRYTDRVNSHCLYGQVDGFEEDGQPIRKFGWTETWDEGDDQPFLVYGHTVVPHPYFSHNTVDIDTGCVFGDHLTAFRWPEREIVSVRAKKVYFDK